MFFLEFFRKVQPFFPSKNVCTLYHVHTFILTLLHTVLSSQKATRVFNIKFKSA
jgi:hypothetical protein